MTMALVVMTGVSETTKGMMGSPWMTISDSVMVTLKEMMIWQMNLMTRTMMVYKMTLI